jgi:hypothetical protein
VFILDTITWTADLDIASRAQPTVRLIALSALPTEHKT